ncbi:hypothetical protein E3P89_01762 [Wallemia ichthyophaga]|uniref:Uncharacterized protein n=1 Tax=Wallemia ichthyophaga TaxID=245174 RepID=A0A4T0HGW0_WALIC|nr:hypothetical protein E3P95_03365 [Wallemia ichthyophaga]TIA97250.1 hypothetical protein E3P94_03373 [Wallemia ichthyophaga]TIB12046.1 hypothetical protein E3P90_02154 [Wallemia ichthyophaga]TIB13301.1 hypothetical protein E3P93_01991 [Wallemia ichthyophaga]TIB23022.1 hypothetical protein E3P89_01762 [Wallemia ichthyophaga]
MSSHSDSHTRKYTPPASTGWIKAGEPSTRPSGGVVRRQRTSPAQLDARIKSSKWTVDRELFSRAMSNTKDKLLSSAADMGGERKGSGKNGKNGKNAKNSVRPQSKIFWNPEEYYRRKEAYAEEKEKEKELEHSHSHSKPPSPSQQQHTHVFDAPSSPSSLAKELTSGGALSQLARMRHAAGLSPVDEEKRAKDRLTTLRERRVELEMRKAMLADDDGEGGNGNASEEHPTDSLQSHLAALATFSKRLNQVTIPSLKRDSNGSRNRNRNRNLSNNTTNNTDNKRRKYTQDMDNHSSLFSPPMRSTTIEDLEADQDQREDEWLFTQNGNNGYRTFTQILTERTPQKSTRGLSNRSSVLVANTPSPRSPSKELRQSKLKVHTPPKDSHTHMPTETSIPTGAIGFPELERAWEGTRPITQNKGLGRGKRDKEKEKQKDTKRQSLISGWITQSQNDELGEEVADDPQKRLWGGLDMDSTDRPNVSLDVDSDCQEEDDYDDIESLDMETPKQNRTAQSLPLEFLHDDSPSSERGVANIFNDTKSQ